MVAIDGSEPSLDAAGYAISLADVYHSDLTALYVVSSRTSDDYDSDMQDEMMPESVKKIMDEARKESDPWFTRIRDEIKSQESSIKFHSKIIISAMKASGIIVNYAENTNVELIVVGTRGRTGFKRLLLGSVASDVVTYAHCPVLVVK
ncbi:MAG TPA: universal stress protein [Nitrososphaeraceae archaeon]|jgi:nucleotide-binding universal stress UspA family protein|nr:universal stress protein [Nitrososphaeraceae archaeon]